MYSIVTFSSEQGRLFERQTNMQINNPLFYVKSCVAKTHKDQPKSYMYMYNALLHYQAKTTFSYVLINKVFILSVEQYYHLTRWFGILHFYTHFDCYHALQLSLSPVVSTIGMGQQPVSIGSAHFITLYMRAGRVGCDHDILTCFHIKCDILGIGNNYWGG